MLEARMRSSVLEADTLAQRAARATSLSPEATMRVTEERVKLPAN
jgi:hypothetical protein